jgi:2-polyprenyl-3-methyl-5-hydroxy-6-metoxy-1,4-benzoquinol methylase
MSQPFWEKAYADLDTPAIRGGEPSQEIREIVSQLPSAARVLGLGCGEGRNALFLAECGFRVTAVDIEQRS